MGLKPVVTCVWPLGCVLGEGPVWWQDALWCAGINAYATTAHNGVTDASQKLAGGLFCFEADVPGQPQFCTATGHG